MNKTQLTKDQQPSSRWVLRSLLFTFVLSLHTVAHPCPDFLRGIKSDSLRKVDSQTGQVTNDGDLCAFHDRYQKARAQIIAQNVNPDFIVDVRAPKLVNLPDWKRETSGGFLNLFSNYNPNTVYRDPKGNYTVWEGWNTAATYVDLMALQNLQALTHNVSQLPRIDLDWLMNIHLRALATSEPGIAGKIRAEDSVEVGLNFHRDTASKVAEIQAVSKNEYPSTLFPGKSILSFHKTQCMDELSLQSRLALSTSAARTIDFTLFEKEGDDFQDSQGVWRHCGYFVYSDGREVRRQLALLLEETTQNLNRFTISRAYEWQKMPKSSLTKTASQDPLLIAARAQRWFVSIYPFGGGNGRTSRFLLDSIVESFGLPAPTFENMNLDIVTTEAAWARQVGVGMERVVGILEYCASHLDEPRCSTNDALYANAVLKQDAIIGK